MKKFLGLSGALALFGLLNTGCPNPGFPQPENTVVVNFSMDATGRPGWYHDGDLEWKGTLTYDTTTRMLTPGTSWDGPFAPLYDDGPWTTGGHEPAGATAADNKFGIAAFVTIPTAEVTLEYGAQTKEGGWIWNNAIGTGDPATTASNGNGQVKIPANATTAVTCPGQKLSTDGPFDVKFVLDTANLDTVNTTVTYTAGDTVQLKGPNTGWDLVTAYDDATHGDTTSGDGKFTYTLGTDSVRRVKASAGDNVEFIWVIHGAEYKTSGGVAEQVGVSAQTNNAGAGWNNATVSLNTVNNNTQVEVR